MSYETPILTAGNPSNQTIWDSVSDARHTVGTRGSLSDGRVFYYACNRSSAIDAGDLLIGSQVSGDFDDLAVNTPSIGDTSLTITSVGSKTYVKDELEGGYVMAANADGVAGAGRMYRILGHPTWAAATAVAVEIEAIRDEAFAAAITVFVVPNPWSAVIQAPAAAAHFVAGAAIVDVSSGSSTPQYFWCQTWGVCSIVVDVVSDILGHSMVSGTTLVGSVIGFVDAAGDVPQIIGVNLFGPTVDNDYTPVFLQIAP